MTTYVIFVVMVSSSAKKRAVFLRGIPADLIRETKALAARRGKTLSGFVAEALGRAINDTGADTEREVDLSSDMEWYERNRNRLTRDFLGQYVAIVEQQVVDHHDDFQTLAERVFKKYGDQSIFMPRVSSGPSPVHVRSPRIRQAR
jgi:hypothetical protein